MGSAPKATTADGRTARTGPRRPRPLLRQLAGADGRPAADTSWELRPGRVTMGRDVAPDEGILVDDSRASRKHATLHVASRSYKVRIADEESRHGTWIDGLRIEEAWLEDETLIRVGDSFFLLRYQPAEVEDSLLPGLLGVAPAIRQLRADISRVAEDDVTVMILGESGSGKEVVARSIHEASGREGPFVAVNCAAIPEQLAESQLFGHVAGSFTGARGDHEGYFRAAEGGTIFLDEIGDLPLALQPKLLRALEQRTVTPVGTTEPLEFDARIVVATHRQLEQAVESGDFRGDLYARLAQFTLAVPPLRARREDVLMLLDHALEGAASIEPELVEALLSYDWPYNVRELFAVASELRVRGKGQEVLQLSMVEHRLGVASQETSASSAKSRSSSTQIGSSSGIRAEPPNREELEALVAECKGNVRAIARATGRSRMQVYRWLEQYGIDLSRYRS